jgi:hypothetical protein
MNIGQMYHMSQIQIFSKLFHFKYMKATFLSGFIEADGRREQEAKADHGLRGGVEQERPWSVVQ